MRINLQEDDIMRILQVFVTVSRPAEDHWSHGTEAEMQLRRTIWQKKSGQFPGWIFNQLHEDGFLERQSRGESMFYRVTDKAVSEFALDVPWQQNNGDGAGVARAGVPPVPADSHDSNGGDFDTDKIREVVLAVRERADEDGLAQDTDVFSELRRTSARWASIQWAYFSTEMNKLIKDGWLERGDGSKRNCYCQTAKSQQQFGDDKSVQTQPAEDPPVVESPVTQPPAPPPPLPVDPVPPPSPPPTAEASSEESSPPQQGDEVSNPATTQGKEDTMKLTEKAKKLPFPERVRLSWTNTPGKTAEEKREHVFNRYATDVLQKIFGLNSANSAQQFMDKLREEGLLSGAGGSYYWDKDMSNYSGVGESDASGGGRDEDGGQLDPPVPGPSRRGPRPGPRPKVTPEPPEEDTAPDANESTETDEFIATDDLHVVFTQARWLLPALKVAILLGRVLHPEERTLALMAIKEFAALSGEDMPQALNMLNSIFPEPPTAEPEEEE